MRTRVRQFIQAGRTPTDEDLALAQRELTPELFALFMAQHPRDVVHGAATARWLLERGHADPDLVTAGFVHDVGKGFQRRWHRAAYVVLAHAKLTQRAADPGSRFEVRRALERTRTHSTEGAAMLRKAGASPRVVELTRLHHGPPGSDRMLALLQEADAAS